MVHDSNAVSIPCMNLLHQLSLDSFELVTMQFTGKPQMLSTGYQVALSVTMPPARDLATVSLALNRVMVMR